MQGSISTTIKPIPIQIELDKGYSTEAVDELIRSSFWLRDLVAGVGGLTVGYMLYAGLNALSKNEFENFTQHKYQ